MTQTDDTATMDATLEKATRMLDEGRKLLNAIQTAMRFSTAIRPDGTCPIFFDDAVFPIALPWADFEQFQVALVSKRAPRDELFLRQILDIVPTLKGRAMLDVGSFTGTTAMVLRHFLSPRETHLFEPQKTMTAALRTTIASNGGADDVTLHTDIIDEEDQQILMGSYKPERLCEVPYLRREGAALRSRAIDTLGISDIGLINLDYNNVKINALRGAAETIARDRPIVSIDLTGRDADEVKAFLAPFDYEDMRAGKHSIVFLPR